jgi:hypothetical protein
MRRQGTRQTAERAALMSVVVDMDTGATGEVTLKRL